MEYASNPEKKIFFEIFRIFFVIFFFGLESKKRKKKTEKLKQKIEKIKEQNQTRFFDEKNILEIFVAKTFLAKNIFL